MKTALMTVAALLAASSSTLLASEKKEKPKPPTVRIAVVAAPLEKTADGFIDANNLWQIDSAKDFSDAIKKKKCWHPLEKTKKAMPHLKEFCFEAVEDNADVTVTVVARGVNVESLGARTTMSFYRGVAIADTVPTAGVTRWVSVVLTSGTYKKEFVAWSTNTSRWSLGAWKDDAAALVGVVADWCLINQAKLLQERQ